MVKGTAEIGVRASAGGSFIAKSAIVDLNKRAHISAPQRRGMFIGRVVLMHAAGKLNRRQSYWRQGEHVAPSPSRILVLGAGLEPACLSAYAPQTYVSAIPPPEPVKSAGER